MARVPDDPSTVSGPYQAEVELAPGEPKLLARGDLVSIEPGRLAPVRIPRASNEGENKSGKWFSSLMRRHVLYESLLERNRMMMLDFDPDTKVYLEQPLKVRFKAGGKPRVHVPDLLLWRHRGSMVLCDVKPKSRLRDKNFPAQAEATARFCEHEGIDYAVLSEPDGQTLENLRWLRGYWQVPFQASDDFLIMRERLAKGPAKVGELLAIGGPEILSKPVVFAALWWRAFLCDISVPFGRDTKVWDPHSN